MNASCSVVGINAYPALSWTGDLMTVFSNAVNALYDGCVVPIVIDIKPGSDVNSINLRSRGVQPVAVLTTSIAAGDQADFDASTVAGGTVTLGDGAGIDALALRWNLEDVDHDGDLDLVLHFSTHERPFCARAARSRARVN